MPEINETNKPKGVEHQEIQEKSLKVLQQKIVIKSAINQPDKTKSDKATNNQVAPKTSKFAPSPDKKDVLLDPNSIGLE